MAPKGTRQLAALGATGLLVGLAGCGGGAPESGSTSTRPATLVASTPNPAAAEPGGTAGSPTAPPARSAVSAASQRRTFTPTEVVLADSSTSGDIEPVDTGPTGDLQLPTKSGQVGWWRSGALAGEAYGSVVLAGHVDTRTGGLGYFAQLLRSKNGDRVTLRGSGLRQVYRVSRVVDIPKADLSRGTRAFAQDVPARLVLITCTGTFDRRTGHYDQNRVVYAEPVGTATPG